MNKKKIAYFVTEDWAFLCHRLPMAEAARDAGYEVSVIANDTGQAQLIRDKGFEFIALPAKRGSNNPMGLFLTLFRIVSILKKLKPDLVHNVAIKPILLVGLASFFSPKSLYLQAVTGLGTAFLGKGLKASVLQFVIRNILKILAGSKRNYFLLQNEDDLNYLKTLNILREDRTFIIRGSGIDVQRFAVMPEPETEDGSVRLGFVGRMLIDKGVRELRQAFRDAKAGGSKIELVLAGRPDPENPSSLSLEEMEEWAREDGVSWLGHLEDVRDLWAQVHIAVLPSYREGLPRSLLEAAACGRAIVATDVPGCREIAHHGLNALTVPLKEVKPLAEAFEKLAEDPELRKEFAEASRNMVLSDLSAEAVGKALIALYVQILAEHAGDRA
ncbi:glycosyltransferase family 4 protein [Kiloniella sp. b19]|uniref:glycosyltransferase family 4 protein n=1 Tax=Kiloniella sp. GXU_MW_B19 TaxID=3141326 RepID=UPI0031E334CB